MKEIPIARFRVLLTKWHSSNKRNFIWRGEKRNPYLTLISEMLLRKTKAETVDTVIREFVKVYPNPKALASAKPRSLKSLIRPLGLYNIRGENLINVSKVLITDYKGKIPSDFESLIRLPHVGRYSANATLLFGFDKFAPIVDANIARIISRVFNKPYPNEIHKADYLWDMAAILIPKKSPKIFVWAMLDFGAEVCKAREPYCKVCPLTKICAYDTRHKVPLKKKTPKSKRGR